MAPPAEVRAHIAQQQRLRDQVTAQVAAAWAALPSYDEGDVATFLAAALPVVLAAQRAAVLLTNAFLGLRLGRGPAEIDPDRLIGPHLRNGTEPSDVYRRPFVTTWSKLKEGTGWEDAVKAGGDRATSAAATDCQLAMRETLREVGEKDDLILGFQRVPDPGACDFCRLVAGQRYTTGQLMPIHNHCGCGVDVITEANRGDFTGDPEHDLSVSREDGLTAAVEEHGELGPVLVDGAHAFTAL